VLTCACTRQRTSAHLLIEKPLCTTVEDCLKVEEMQKADKHAGSRVIWVGMEYRFIPSIAQLIQETEAGKIGDPKMLAIREHRFPFLRKVGHWNRFNRYSGACIERDAGKTISVLVRTHARTRARARARTHTNCRCS